MRGVILTAAAALAVLGAPVLAQDAAAPLKLRAGQLIRTADGHPAGEIDSIQSQGGQPVSVSLIYNQHFIHVPATTLSTGPKGVVTSLTRKDLDALN